MLALAGGAIVARRDQAEEMRRAANRFAEAAERLSESLDRFVEFRRYEGREFDRTRGERLPGELVLGLLGAGELPDEEAGELANDAVHRAREEVGRKVDAKAPSQEEIARWWRDGGADPDATT